MSYLFCLYCEGVRKKSRKERKKKLCISARELEVFLQSKINYEVLLPLWKPAPRHVATGTLITNTVERSSRAVFTVIESLEMRSLT